MCSGSETLSFKGSLERAMEKFSKKGYDLNILVRVLMYLAKSYQDYIICKRRAV